MTTQTIDSGFYVESKGKNIALWTVQVLLAGMFIMAGASKLSGAEQMVQMYNAIGIGQWFRYVTGLIEVGAALLLFAPRLAGVGATLLSCTMVGAILTHLFVIGGNPAMPIVLLATSAVVAAGRKDRTLSLLGL
jgi:putative oxidoreductase